MANPNYNMYYAVIGGTVALLFLFFMMNTSESSTVVQPTESSSETPPPVPTRAPLRHISDEDAYAALGRAAIHIKEGGSLQCNFENYGSEWGAHELCHVKPTTNCRFISYGISVDYSFDTDLATKAKCKGLALDPTVNHKAKLHENVWFMSVGATSMEQLPADWFVSSVPTMMKWAKWDYIDVLKMDCEGCEYALARDILEEDPKFFDRIGQFAVELHVSRRWVNSLDRIINLGKLFLLMEEAGIEVISARIGGCHPDDEAPGCHPKLVELGYPCGTNQMCQNLLFARPEPPTPVA